MPTHTPEVIARIFEHVVKADGGWFKVVFIKRTTGEEREMTCRTGVKKHVTGAGLKYNPTGKNLIPVWVANEGKDGADAYRMINVEGVTSITYDYKTYTDADGFAEPVKRTGT